VRIEVVEDVAAAAAEIIVKVAGQGGHIALSGGSTPGFAYRMAAEQLADWSDATLWFGDDRAVPPDHAYSNFHMVDVALLSRVSAPPRVERILGEQGADAAAGDYEARLREGLGNRPRLDLALMGLGPDAHTASLFPSKPEVNETQRFVVAVPEAGMAPQVPRVSMTLPVFNAAARVVFLVTGKDKAMAMRRAFGAAPDPSAPAARVRPENGELLVLCDAAAAAQLIEEEGI
jgi:6-phosphogluconolactonase